MTAELQRDIDIIDQVFRSGEQLSQAVRADLVLRRRELYQRLHPDADGHGGARRGWRFKHERAPSFVAATAAALKLSHATVRRLLRLAEDAAC